ncbi:MAG: Nif3-like dinuclear metal center hexameric protein [Bacteroidetes bacterium]|nr:MAG: Nif3-like dinuclear metal center hexameric protein [Bacteroidota bacterium]
MKKIKQVTDFLETLAPLSYQESYDNCGLLTGQADWEIKKILITLDCTEEVVDEAIATGCNLIVAHHPIIFSGLKKLNGKTYVERTIIKAIKNDIAIYAIHTNLDNVITGVNAKISAQLGLQHTKILDVKSGGLLKKLVVYVPKNYLQVVQEAIFNAGGGNIGHYSECSFFSEGVGTFKGNNQSNAFVGEKNKQHLEPEYKLEVLLPAHCLNKALQAAQLAHPYEEMAYDVLPINNANPEVGSGMIGELPEALAAKDFLHHVKTSMNLQVIKFTPFDKPIKKVAVCGGSGSFLLGKAIADQADAFVSADFKYHEYFDAENRLMIADIGHYESEIFTINLLADKISEKFPIFAVILSNINTNPINYYF